MSGPKTSRYTLTAAQRRILIEQRQAQMEYELLRNKIADCRSVLSKADETITKAKKLWDETESDKEHLSKTDSLRNELLIQLEQNSSMNTSSGSVKLRTANAELSEKSAQLLASIKQLAKQYGDVRQAFEREISQKISDGFSVSFADIGEHRTTNDELLHQIQAVLDELAELTLSDDMKTAMDAIHSKVYEIDRSEYLKNYYAMTVVPFAKKCRQYSESYETYGAEYNRKRFIYETNAKRIGICPEVVEFSETAIERLNHLIEDTERVLEEKAEQEYISRCVDEAMHDMGYTVLGTRDIQRRNGRKYHNELYRFDDGVAVNVTYASNGQITMELGGVCNEDRLPVAEESDALVEDMRSFCTDYAELEKRLAEKGIRTSRISVLPPDAQYAQIINISDYELNQAVSEFEVSKKKNVGIAQKSQKLGE